MERDIDARRTVRSEAEGHGALRLVDEEIRVDRPHPVLDQSFEDVATERNVERLRGRLGNLMPEGFAILATSSEENADDGPSGKDARDAQRPVVAELTDEPSHFRLHGCHGAPLQVANECPGPTAERGSHGHGIPLKCGATVIIR